MKFAIIGGGGVGQVIASHLVKGEEAKVRVADRDVSRLKDLKRFAGEINVFKLEKRGSSGTIRQRL